MTTECSEIYIIRKLLHVDRKWLERPTFNNPKTLSLLVNPIGRSQNPKMILLGLAFSETYIQKVRFSGIGFAFSSHVGANSISFL
jgi:hypothetical protein